MEQTTPIFVRASSSLPTMLPVSLLSETGVEVFSVRIHRGKKPPSPEIGELVDSYNQRFLFYDQYTDAYTYYVEESTLCDSSLAKEDIVKLVRMFNVFTGMYYFLVT